MEKAKIDEINQKAKIVWDCFVGLAKIVVFFSSLLDDNKESIGAIVKPFVEDCKRIAAVPTNEETPMLKKEQ